MKKVHLTTTLLISISVLTCQNPVSNQETSGDSLAVQSEMDNIKSNSVEESLTESTGNEKKYDELIIKGKDIWVREVPSTGKVVMKLNDGDKCKILQKSELSFVKGLPDYWYQVEFNDNQGWVFGSQTSICLFKPLEEPFSGNLITCSDEFVSLSETPSSYSYSLKSDLTFIFSVSAGYIIKGEYAFSGNLLTFRPVKLEISTPDGNELRSLSGTISFWVYLKDTIICMIEKESNLKEKEYAPQAGCYCKE